MFTLRNLILSTLILLSISNKLFAQFTNATFLDDKIRFSESRGLDYDAPTDALFYNGLNNGRVVKLGDPSGNGWFMGNLGLGTKTPVNPMQIEGNVPELNLLIKNTSSTTGARTYLTSFATKSSIRTDKDFTISTLHNSLWSDKFVFTNAGRFGIGTESPINALQIESSEAELNILLKNTSISNGARTYITSFANKSSIQTDKNFTIRTLNGSIWQDQITVMSDGNVAMGTSDPKGYKLAVAGKTISEEVVVKLQGSWPDYVFSNNYNLRSLDEVEKFIKQNKHLPEVPSENEVKENGVNLGDMNAVLLKKVEELTLYMIELKKENQSLKTQNKETLDIT